MAGYTENGLVLAGGTEHELLDIEIYENVEYHFGEAAHEDVDGSDDDNGDDIW